RVFFFLPLCLTSAEKWRFRHGRYFTSHVANITTWLAESRYEPCGTTELQGIRIKHLVCHDPAGRRKNIWRLHRP
ncbi:hypothetical protein EDC04DRAFT_2746366, partial [Pisolithus marmoratus]